MRNRASWLAVGVIIVVGAATYASGLHGVFAYDDMKSVRDNVHIRSLWPPSEAISWPVRKSRPPPSRKAAKSCRFSALRAGTAYPVNHRTVL